LDLEEDEGSSFFGFFRRLSSSDSLSDDEDVEEAGFFFFFCADFLDDFFGLTSSSESDEVPGDFERLFLFLAGESNSFLFLGGNLLSEIKPRTFFLIFSFERIETFQIIFAANFFRSFASSSQTVEHA